MNFPDWLNIRNVIPLNYIPLSPEQKNILNENIPLPKGKGKTARIVARENLKERIAPLLDDVTLLRSQVPFGDLKTAITLRDLAKVQEEVNKLAQEYNIAVPNINSEEEFLQFKAKLSEISFEIDPRVFSDFYEEFIESFHKSAIQPGTNIGPLAGLALGQPVSQSMLSDFHTVNSSFENSMERLARMKSILLASDSNAKPKSYFAIKYNPPSRPDSIIPAIKHHTQVQHVGTFDQIFNLRMKMEEITLQRILLTSPVIYNEDDIRKLGLRNLYKIYYMLNPSLVLQNPKFNYALELTLNPYLLYFYKLTLKMIVDKINNFEYKKIKVIAFYTSQNLQKDPHTNKIFIFATDDESSVQLNNFQNISHLVHISGIPDIQRVIPLKQDIMSIIKNIEFNQDDGKWTITINKFKTIYSQVSTQDLITFFRQLKCETELIPDRQIPEFWTKFKVWLKTPYLGNNRWQITNRRTFEGIADIIDDTTIENFSLTGFVNKFGQNKRFFFSAMTLGANLNYFLKMKIIDHTKFFINNIKEMNKHYGFYPTYLTITNELTNYILNISDTTDTEHILIIMDTLYMNGYSTGTSHKGFFERGASVLERASLNRAGYIFSQAGAVGTEDVINNVTSSIHTGILIKSGTGIIKTSSDNSQAIIEEEKEQKDEDFDDLSNLVFDEQINVVDETIPPPQPIDPESAEGIRHQQLAHEEHMEPDHYMQAEEPLRLVEEVDELVLEDF